MCNILWCILWLLRCPDKGKLRNVWAQNFSWKWETSRCRRRSKKRRSSKSAAVVVDTFLNKKKLFFVSCFLKEKKFSVLSSAESGASACVVNRPCEKTTKQKKQVCFVLFCFVFSFSLKMLDGNGLIKKCDLLHWLFRQNLSKRNCFKDTITCVSPSSLFKNKTGAFCSFVCLQIYFSNQEHQQASQKIASYSWEHVRWRHTYYSVNWESAIWNMFVSWVQIFFSQFKGLEGYLHIGRVICKERPINFPPIP